MDVSTVRGSGACLADPKRRCKDSHELKGRMGDLGGMNVDEEVGGRSDVLEVSCTPKHPHEHLFSPKIVVSTAYEPARFLS